MKLVEFLYFYLMPETPQAHPQVPASASNTAVLGGRGRELVAAFERNRRETIGGVEKAGGDASKTRSTDEKQKMLGKYLGNVEDLVEDLRESGGPFAGGAF
jgi:Cell division control protein 14, SIN component